MNDPAPARGTRAIAAGVVAAIIQREDSLNSLLTEAGSHLSPRDRAFLAELCYGTIRFYPRLAALLRQLLARPLKAKDKDLEALLLIGFYQLSYMRVPDHAAISATVEACKQRQKPWAKGLINGVLRQYQRTGPSLLDQLSDAELASHPAWLWKKINRDWPAQLDAILAANNHAPPMTLRVNGRRISREDYIDLLEDSGLSANPCSLSPFGVQLAEPCDVSQLPDFEAGACSVQDEASQLAAPLLDPAHQQRLLDCCCAPGGKTGHLLELGADGLLLDAVEIDGARLQKVATNLRRLNLHANLINADGSRPVEWWDDTPYDGILLDAPCSASGVIRRHPDIKLLRQSGDIVKLAAAQLALLCAVWPCLKPGGLLVYTTCSILKEENDQVIEGFLEHTSDARHLPIAGNWGVQTAHGRQLLPQTGGHDGFYYARLCRTPTAADKP